MWHFLNLYVYLILVEFSPWHTQVPTSYHYREQNPLHSPSMGFCKPHVLILMGASGPSLKRVLPRTQLELSEKDVSQHQWGPLTYHRRTPPENKANT